MTAISSLRAYPDELAYFNELAGGPTNGWRHLLGSNLDWGQNWLYFKHWIAQEPSAGLVMVHDSLLYNPEDLGIVGIVRGQCDAPDIVPAESFLHVYDSNCYFRRALLQHAEDEAKVQGLPSSRDGVLDQRTKRFGNTFYFRDSAFW